MRLLRSLSAPLVGLLLGASVLVAQAQVSPVATDPADFRLYAANGASLAFVASGVSALDDCAQPLDFRESRRGSVQILEIICPGGKRPRFARLTFVRVKSARGVVGLSPFRVEFLP